MEVELEPINQRNCPVAEIVGNCRYPLTGPTFGINQDQPNQLPQIISRPPPHTATASIFAPRTKDMNKGFLTFSEDQPGLTSKNKSLITSFQSKLLLPIIISYLQKYLIHFLFFLFKYLFQIRYFLIC